MLRRGWPLPIVASIVLSCGGLLLAQEEKKPEEGKPVPPAERELPRGLAQEVPAEPPSWALRVDLRVGGAVTGTFDAQTPLGGRRLKSDLLLDTGFDAGVDLGRWWVVLTADYAASGDVRSETAGLLFGATWDAIRDDSFALDVQAGAGPLFGRLDVDVQDFGGFESAVGFELRVSVVSWLQDKIGLSLWAELRQISYKYEEDVLSGDTRTSGTSFGFGVGFVVRF